ncbi:MAG: ribonuclease P protein component, partial [Planctomycetota bacterium]
MEHTSNENPEPNAEQATRHQRGERFEGWMRIRRGAEFSTAYKRGGRARGRWFTVVAARNELGFSRLGLSIGKRAWKRAVPRNRLRRLVREAFRLSYRELPHGYDLIVVGSSHEARPTLDEARADLVRSSATVERVAVYWKDGSFDDHRIHAWVDLLEGIRIEVDGPV